MSVLAFFVLDFSHMVKNFVLAMSVDSSWFDSVFSFFVVAYSDSVVPMYIAIYCFVLVLL